jgi:outer membrane biosynthesis protein TonB
VPAVALTSGGDSPAPRRTLAFSLSLLIHFVFLLLILGAVRRDVAPPPLEIAIIEGSEGAAAGQSGEEHSGAGPLAATRADVKPVEAPQAPAAQKAPARPKAMAKPVEPPVVRPVVEDERLAASSSQISTPLTPPFAGAPSSALADRKRAEGDATRALDGGGGAAAGGLGDGAHTPGFSVSGAGRSYTSIWQGTQRYLAGLRWAYNNELRANATLRGVIVVRYEILADGAVGDVALVSSQLRAPRLEQQVLSQIRDWRYPSESTGTVIVTWPFSFLPPH